MINRFLSKRLVLALCAGLFAVGIAGFAAPQKAEAYFSIVPQAVGFIGGVIQFPTPSGGAPAYFVQFPYMGFYGYVGESAQGINFLALPTNTAYNVPLPAGATYAGTAYNTAPGKYILLYSGGGLGTGQGMWGSGRGRTGYNIMSGGMGSGRNGSGVIMTGNNGSGVVNTGVVTTGTCTLTTTPMIAGYAPFTVTLNGTATNGAIFSVVTRGDGVTTNLPPNMPLTHTYTTPGTYTIWAYLTYPVGGNPLAQAVPCKKVITVKQPPVVITSGQNGSGGAYSGATYSGNCTLTTSPLIIPAMGVNFPYTITLYGTTTPVGGTFYRVNWGDGTTTNSPNLVAGTPHTYTLPGTYNIVASWGGPAYGNCNKPITIKKKIMFLVNGSGQIVGAGQKPNPDSDNATTVSNVNSSTVAKPTTKPVQVVNSVSPVESSTKPTTKPPVAVNSAAVAQERKDFRTEYATLARNAEKGANVVEKAAIRDVMSDALKLLTEGVKSLRRKYEDGIKVAIPFTRIQWRGGVNDLLKAYRTAVIDTIELSKVDAFDKDIEAKRLYLYDMFEKLEIVRRVQLMIKK